MVKTCLMAILPRLRGRKGSRRSGKRVLTVGDCAVKCIPHWQFIMPQTTRHNKLFAQPKREFLLKGGVLLMQWFLISSLAQLNG